MSISSEQLKQLQKLAAIKLSESEEQKLWEELEQIVDFLGQLDQVDTTWVAPMISPITDHILPLAKNDDSFDTVSSKDLLQNVKHTVTGNSIEISGFVEK